MSILNNLKDFFIPTEVDDDNDTGYKQEQPESEKEPAPSYTSSSSSSQSSSSSRRETSYTPLHEERRNTSSVSSSVSSYTGSYGSGSSSASVSRPSFSASPTLQVILVKPTEYTDAKKIADHLMNGRTVVLVLEDATEQTRRRIIDFLIGVAYAMNGNLKPIANQTYIVTPHDVGLVDQLVSELQGKNYSDAAAGQSLI
ncbi:MAG: cell division protein SepF [Oscillospiraceae bacterium]|nr:cell division protein SepF [Oscillospiraceae bacterium]